MSVWAQNIRQALGSIRSNKLRAGLTICIIAFGIQSIVGVLTSIDGIKYWMMDSFSTLGANTFKIQANPSALRIGGPRPEARNDNITFRQAMEFRERMGDLAVVNIAITANFVAQARYENQTTNNNIRLEGSDENFVLAESYQIEEGRSITPDDIKNASPVVVIGQEVRKKCFPATNPIGKVLYVDRQAYTVVGVLKEKGTSFGSPGDKVCKVPITRLMQDVAMDNPAYTINVYVEQPEYMEQEIDQATGVFRLVRRLKPYEENDFGIVKSDSFINSLMENISLLTLSATAIAIITLFGASISLMNIMLVSVTERTREIGLRKAIGATRSQILMQFLTEAITICQLGGLLGIALGVGIGLLISSLLGVAFVTPWLWIGMGIAICFVVGLASGIYPARKAASLDPIEALRYE